MWRPPVPLKNYPRATPGKSAIVARQVACFHVALFSDCLNLRRERTI